MAHHNAKLVPGAAAGIYVLYQTSIVIVVDLS